MSLGEALMMAVAVTPTVIFGFLLYFHAKSERRATMALVTEAMRQLNSKNSMMASEAKATEMYQEEAIREQQVEFDKQKDAPPADPGGARILTNQHGETFEVIAGMD